MDEKQKENKSDKKKKPPIASREEVEGVFLEDQKISDEQRRDVANAAEDALRSIQKTALNSADIIGMINAEEGAVLDWMYSTLTPQNEQVAVNMGGGPELKGSSSKGRKKRKRRRYRENDPWILE